MLNEPRESARQPYSEAFVWRGVRRVTSTEKGKKFERIIADLFLLMGYDVESNALVDSGQTDLRAELKMGMIRQKLIVECKSYHSKSVGIEDVNKFSSRVVLARQSGQVDFGIFVSNTEFTAEARASVEKYPFVKLRTYREILSELIDFEPYVRRFIYDYENYDEYSEGQRLPIAGILNRCNLKKYYIPLNSTNEAGVKFDPIDRFFDGWLEDSQRNHVTLLGDYGAGKSSFCLHLTYELAKKYLNDPANNRIPLFISLRDYSKAINVQQLITDLLINTYGLRLSSYEAFQKLLETGKLVLIFDGFDEMATKVDKETTFRNFQELANVVTANSKTLLTCRTHYFKSRTHLLDVFSPQQDTELMKEIRKRNNFEVLELREFDSKQIVELLQKRTKDWKLYWDRIRAIYNLEDLARRPILLDMIIKTLPKLIEKRIDVDQTALYDEYSSYWIEREDWRSQLSKEEKKTLMENLGFQMFKTGQELIHYSKLYDAVKEQFSRRIVTYSDVDYFDNDTRTCTFLNRDKEGNYKFIHRSFMEFFVAKKLAREIRDHEMGNLDVRILTPEILQFLASLLRSKGDVKISLQAYLGNIKSRNPKSALAEENQNSATNALTLLNLLGADLKKKNFSSVALPYVDLSGANLWGSNFSRSKLPNANLDGAVLEYVDFSYADLSGASFGSTDVCSAIAYSPDGKRLATGDSTGVVKIWDIGRRLNPRVLRGHTNQVLSLCFSPNGENIASASADDIVFVRDSRDGRTLFRIEQGSTLHDMSYNNDGSCIVTVGSDDAMKIWDATSGKLIHTLKLEATGEGKWIISCNPVENSVAVGGRNQSIEIYDLCSHVRKLNLKECGKRITDLCFSDDGRFVVSVASNRDMRVWDAKDGREAINVRTQIICRTVCVSPDLETIAVAGDDPLVRICDFKKGQIVSTLKGHKDNVTCLDFDPQGVCLATGSRDGTAMIWNLWFRDCVFTLGRTPSCFGMNIKGVTGLSENQITQLKKLGAKEMTGKQVEFFKRANRGKAVDFA